MMQLAPSPRPHPPPVPPRPSRQVVAEALKRSTRLPCPTRQAPPPPNTRPWRSEDHRAMSVSQDCRDGRTLVYESVNRDASNREESQRSASEPCEDTSPLKLSEQSCAEVRSHIRETKNVVVTGERDRQVKSKNDKTWQRQRRANGKVPDEGMDRMREDENSIRKSESSSANGGLDDVGSVLDTPEKGTEEKNDNILATTKSMATPEPMDETTSWESENNDTAYNGIASTTISGDDCTTVVVIEENQRKISFNEDNIQHQDWLEAGIRYSSTKITLPYGDETNERNVEESALDYQRTGAARDHEDTEDRNDSPIYCEQDFASIRERIAMSSLQGLPPLPRSLSGFNLNEGRREAGEPPPPPPARSSSKTPKNIKSTQPSSSRPSPPGRQLTTLDTQLAILRKEMFGLRQLDLSLLSQLWSLNESIQEFRQLLQEQEDRAPSPSPSSEEGDDTSYGSHPPPPPRRPAPLLHHHRPPRPPRPLRPPASDESPSSEEYGAV